MICVIGTHDILYSLPLVPSMVSFAVRILLDIGSLLLKISPVLGVFSVAFYFLGRARRQLLFEAFRKVGTFLPYWIFCVPLKYSAWGMRYHILGDPSGHWWYRPWPYFNGSDAWVEHQYRYSSGSPFDNSAEKRNGSSQIRLLKLYRRWPFSDVCGKLIVCSLDSAPTYDSISYCWGSSIMDHGIFIDGRYLSVTKNAYEVLHARSSYFQERILWIDAICIDQTNDSEKSSQIPLMRKIYSRSARTIVWLGFPPDNFFSVYLLKKLDLAKQWNMLSDSDLLKLGTAEGWFLALGERLRYQWFRRVWVVQEVAVASKIHVFCGGQYIEWGVVVSALDTCLSLRILGHLLITGSLTRQSPDGLQRTGAMKVLQDRLKAIGLAELLLATMDCEATNPRDKVYALYGMVTANSAFPEAMIPDYT
jgi:hypothetical protein